jgi:hypothetical protein
MVQSIHHHMLVGTFFSSRFCTVFLAIFEIQIGTLELDSYRGDFGSICQAYVKDEVV